MESGRNRRLRTIYMFYKEININLCLKVYGVYKSKIILKVVGNETSIFLVIHFT